MMNWNDSQRSKWMRELVVQKFEFETQEWDLQDIYDFCVDPHEDVDARFFSARFQRLLQHPSKNDFVDPCEQLPCKYRERNDNAPEIAGNA